MAPRVDDWGIFLKRISIERIQTLHPQSFQDGVFRPSTLPRLLDRLPELSLSERNGNTGIVEQLDEPAGRKLFHCFDLSTLDSKGSFEMTK